MTPAIDPRDDLAWRRERNAARRCEVLTQRAMAEAFSRRATEIVDLIDDDTPRVVASPSPDLGQIATELNAGLSSVEVFGGRAYIRTPLLLPSGSSVVVVVEQEGKDRFRLTDLGQGVDEAETLGFGRIYRRQAEEVAKLHGLATTQGEIWLADLAREDLVGATMALASAVLRAFATDAHTSDDARARGSAEGVGGVSGVSGLGEAGGGAKAAGGASEARRGACGKAAC